jgi:hypothetical protein
VQDSHFSNRDGCLAGIARAAATIVALAQASLAGAADRIRNGPRPLSSRQQHFGRRSMPTPTGDITLTG